MRISWSFIKCDHTLQYLLHVFLHNSYQKMPLYTIKVGMSVLRFGENIKINHRSPYLKNKV